jgi:hypothetical protein
MMTIQHRHLLFFVALLTGLMLACAPPKRAQKKDDKADTKQKSSQSNSPSSILSRSMDMAKKLSESERQGLRLTLTTVHRAFWSNDPGTVEVQDNEKVLVVDVTFEWQGEGFDLDQLELVDAENDENRYAVVGKQLLSNTGKARGDVDPRSWPKPPEKIRVQLMFAAPTNLNQVFLHLSDYRFTNTPIHVTGG